MNSKLARNTLPVVLAMGYLVRAQSHTSTRDGIYTDSQANRGEASYIAACASCHGGALKGTGAVMPALVGPGFTGKWDGQTLDDLFEEIQSTMPADQPGQLSRAENADILAYILKANHLPAGKMELPSSAGSLKQIKFQAAK